VPELTSPELTGEWEFRLREIEHRKLTRDAFMRDIRELTKDIVGKPSIFIPTSTCPTPNRLADARSAVRRSSSDSRVSLAQMRTVILRFGKPSRADC